VLCLFIGFGFTFMSWPAVPVLPALRVLWDMVFQCNLQPRLLTLFQSFGRQNSFVLMFTHMFTFDEITLLIDLFPVGSSRNVHQARGPRAGCVWMASGGQHYW
jgi:hypothetical protein